MSDVYESFRNLWIWNYLGERVAWYYKISVNDAIAKCLIAKRTRVSLKGPSEYNVEEGLKIYEKYTNEFLKIRREVENGEDLERLEIPSYSLLDMAKDLVWKMMRKSTFFDGDAR